MTKKGGRLFILVLFVVLLAVLGFGQTQTGILSGTVSDEQGNPLPGVTMTITSPSMMGERSYTSTDKGIFRFPSCPPGTYLVSAELQGFQKTNRPDVIVSVGASVPVSIILVPSTISEQVTVVAPSPMVDVKSTTLALTMTKTLIENVPITRDILSVVLLAPSTVAEGPGTQYKQMASIHGGTLQQTTYALDGANLTDPTRGYGAKGVAFDAIEEVEVVGGAVSAEVSQSMGGYVNVVSKSGGNKLSGGLSAIYTGKSFQKSSLNLAQIKAMGLDTPIYDIFNYELSTYLGGPIIKDKIWFFLGPKFVAWDRPNMFIPFTDPTGKSHPSYNTEHTDKTGFAKISVQVAKNFKWMVLWQYMILNENATSAWNNWWRPLDSQKRWQDYTHTLTSNITYVLDQNTLIEGRGSYIFRRMDCWDIPAEAGRPAPQAQDRLTGYMWGSAGNDERYERNKWMGSLIATKYNDRLLGASHEFKVGAEYMWWQVFDEAPRPSPYRQYWYNGTPWDYNDTVPYYGRLTISNGGPNEGDSGRVDYQYAIGAFVQDSITVGKRLTLNLGLRYNTQHVYTKGDLRKGWVDTYYNGLAQVLAPEIFATEDWSLPGVKNIFVWNKLQPRIGLIYDLFGNGKTALQVSFARYAENFLSTMTAGLHPFGNKSVTFNWWDDNHNGYYDLPPIDRYRAQSIPRIQFNQEEILAQVDRKMGPPYLDEYIAKIQHELAKNISISLNFIYKENKDLQENIDLANPIGGDMWLPYTVKDPGGDGRFGTGDDKDLTVYALKSDAASPLLYRTNIQELVRKYRGFELVLLKRMSGNWQLSGSVTYSKNYGNVPSGYYDSEGNRGFYDTPNDLINNWGRLTWDRPLMIKLMGSVILPGRVYLSGFYRHLDGAPTERTVQVYFPSLINGFKLKSNNVTVMADPRGTDRYAAEDKLDIRLEKTFLLIGGSLGIYLDLLNVFGDRTLTIDQNRGGYIYADGSYKQSPTYGKIATVDAIRTLKGTVRFTF